MEKINQSIRKKFPQVRFYLDDLTKIIDILEDNNFKKIEISTFTHKYSKEELANIPNSDSISEIRSNDPFYLSIDFNHSFGAGVSIYAGNDSVLAEGIIQKVGRVLLSRKRIFHFYISKFWFALVVLFLTQSIASYLFVKEKIEGRSLFLIILVAISIYSLSMLLDSGKLFRKNIFYYNNRDDQPSFWSRKKDEIILGFIIVIITIIITKIFS